MRKSWGNFEEGEKRSALNGVFWAQIEDEDQYRLRSFVQQSPLQTKKAGNKKAGKNEVVQGVVYALKQ